MRRKLHQLICHIFDPLIMRNKYPSTVVTIQQVNALRPYLLRLNQSFVSVGGNDHDGFQKAGVGVERQGQFTLLHGIVVEECNPCRNEAALMPSSSLTPYLVADDTTLMSR